MLRCTRVPSVATAFVLALPGLATPSARAAEVYGLAVSPLDVNGFSQLVRFDSATPETAVVIGSTGLGIPPIQSGLDGDAAGNLYLADNATSGFLYSVNKSTGLATLIGGSGLDTDYFIQDIAYDHANQRMLAVASHGATTSAPRLYEVDLPPEP